MGYEIAGAWGAAMQLRERGEGGTVFALTGDGSYLMLNSELYGAVLNNDHLVLVICDNGGFAVINRLQEGHGAASFRTMLSESDNPTPPRVDFRAHAQALGAHAVEVSNLSDFEDALEVARDASGVQVIVIRTHPKVWTEGSMFWEVGVPEVSSRESVRQAREELLNNKKSQRW
jgi:3D-(3,5/4)-trihydroxycyclohexane-1,2-dione acylhydrolase (decyclizing)